VACQRLQTAHLLSYGDLKSELEALSHQAPADQPPTVHENIRGETYYN